MNIFFLDRDAQIAAHHHGDKHVVKMILETAQLLSTAHRVLDGDDFADSFGMYKATHKNHPSAVWVRSNTFAYDWTFRLFSALLDEFHHRRGKTHATARLYDALSCLPDNVPRGLPWMSPPLCMPDEFKTDCHVESYRAYYRQKARDGVVEYNWRPERRPVWMEDFKCAA
jgi:hypothetical protein